MGISVFFRGFLTHLAGICYDFLPQSVNLLVPVQGHISESIPKSTHLMQEFCVVWAVESLTCPKGCTAESGPSFLNRAVAALNVSEMGRDSL